jgi:long-chain fatty acid transport protein
MGTAYTALADDPSAIYFNPAGLSYLEDDFYIQAGWARAMPEHQYTPPMQEMITSKKPANLPYGFLAYKRPKLSFGVGGYVMYGGGGVDWEEADLGQDLDAYMAVLAISPTLAYRVDDHLSLGASLIYYYGINRTTQVESGQTVELDETGKDLGFSVGVLLRPSNVISIGMALISPGSVRMKGTATVEHELLTGLNGEYDSYSEVNLPADFNFGIALKPTGDFTFSADMAYTSWSVLEAMYGEVLDVPAFDPATGQPIIDPSTGEQMLVDMDKTVHLEFGDIIRFKFGAEYRIGFGMAFRAGYIHENAASIVGTLSPFNIDVDRDVIFLGLGYRMGPLQLNLLGMRALGIEREVGLDNPNPHMTPGTYNIDVTVGSLEFLYSM